MPSYPFNAADGLCADAAHAAAMCTSVIRGLQWGLSKAAPRAAAAENASTTRIECGGWASLPAEDSRPRLRLRDTWRSRTPPRWCIGSTRVGGPDGRGEISDPYGGSEPSAVGTELPLLRDTWRHQTVPEQGAGPGPLARWGKCLTRGARLLHPLWRSYGWLREFCLVSVGVGTPATGYRQLPFYF